jgi:hypothetical protein
MDENTGARVLTVADLVSMAEIAGWCQRCLPLVWLADDGSSELVYGTARSIGDERGNFLHPLDDVRDAFVRITMRSGWEWFVPMADVMARQQAGTMVVSDR